MKRAALSVLKGFVVGCVFWAGVAVAPAILSNEWKRRGQEQFIVDANSLLKAQAVRFRFRISETGALSMTFPHPSVITVRRNYEDQWRSKNVKTISNARTIDLQ
jgi:hypothetical protein